MAFDPVPWFTGGGAEHSPEVARTLAFAATSGSEGIVTPTDLKVTATATPSGNVQVATGAVIIPSRAASAANQSYVGRVNTADTVAIAPTSSSGGRTDLIVAQVEDPFVSGEPWQTPSDPATGPYIFTRVISNVPAGTTRLQDVSGYAGRTAVTLARVTIPASTATITQAMITDLRKVARPRRQRAIQQAAITGSNWNLSATSNSPAPQDSQVSALTVDIPSWATYVNISVDVVGLVAVTGPVGGYLDARIGDSTNQIATAGTSYNIQTADGATRIAVKIADTIPIPASMRGTTQRLRVYGRKQAAGSGFLQWQAGSAQHFWDVEFTETAA